MPKKKTSKKKKISKKKKTIPKKKKLTKQELYDNIKLEEIKDWNPDKAIKDLNNTLRRNRREVKKIYEWNYPIKKNLEKSIDDILGVKYKNKNDFVKKLVKQVKSKTKKTMIQKSINDAYANLNQGEIKAAQSTGQTVRKVWTTQFDERVRDWHTRLDGKTIDIKKKFKAYYPGGLDELIAPKVPPISKQNFINCRCFLEYQVGKKKRK